MVRNSSYKHCLNVNENGVTIIRSIIFYFLHHFRFVSQPRKRELLHSFFSRIVIICGDLPDFLLELVKIRRNFAAVHVSLIPSWTYQENKFDLLWMVQLLTLRTTSTIRAFVNNSEPLEEGTIKNNLKRKDKLRRCLVKIKAKKIPQDSRFWVHNTPFECSKLAKRA